MLVTYTHTAAACDSHCCMGIVQETDTITKQHGVAQYTKHAVHNNIFTNGRPDDLMP